MCYARKFKSPVGPPPPFFFATATAARLGLGDSLLRSAGEGLEGKARGVDPEISL